MSDEKRDMDEGKRVGLFGLLADQNRKAIFAFSIVLVLIIGYVDYITGVELSLSFFYLIPVCLIAASSGMPAVALCGALCAGVGILGAILAGLRYSNPLIFAWNGAMRFGTFLLVGYLINRLVLVLEEERQFSRTDALTGVANRRLFYETLQSEIIRSRRSAKPFTLVYIDIDDFKRINDSVGHARGDEALVFVASTLKGQVRETDVVGRIGGDEFVVLLVECGEEDARRVIDKIRKKIGADALGKIGSGLTLSMGALTATATELTHEDLVRKADELMYQVKRAGKDNARFAEA
jgi:diguanylate cyclase (GGDEF)-like protein